MPGLGTHVVSDAADLTGPPRLLFGLSNLRFLHFRQNVNNRAQQITKVQRVEMKKMSKKSKLKLVSQSKKSSSSMPKEDKLTIKKKKKVVNLAEVSKKPGKFELQSVESFNGDEMSLIEKLHKVKAFLNHNVFERESETEGILMTILAKTSCLFLGDVGAAKTMHIRLATSMMGLTTFDTLLGENTKPDTIFGPVDVPALAKGTLRFKTEGFAPTAEIVFFDEIFKAGPVVLNPLLWLINERLFRNGDAGIVKCPLKATFAASNELPTDSTLKAIYDRFLLRYEVSYLKTKDSKMKMLEKISKHADSDHLERIFSDSEKKQLFRLVTRVEVPPEIQASVIKIVQSLKMSLGIRISDRRMGKAMHILQACAVLRGRKIVIKDDLEVLSNVFWEKPEQATKVRAIVYSQASDTKADIISYQEVADSVWEKALASGEMKEARDKLKDIVATCEKFNDSVARGVLNHVRDKLSQVREILKARDTLVVLRMSKDTEPIYKLTAGSAAAWTPKELRSVKFKWFRSGQYWRRPLTSADLDLEARRLKKAVRKKLQAKVLIKVLT